MKADGAICVKTFFERGFGGVRDLPVPKLETIRALVKAAHAAGLPVLIHANTDEAQRFGLDAGVDILGAWIVELVPRAFHNTNVTPGIQKLLDDEVRRTSDCNRRCRCSTAFGICSASRICQTHG